MSILFASLAALFLALLVVALLNSKRLEKLVVQRDGEVAAANQRSETARRHYESEAVRIHKEAQASVADAQNLVDQQLAEMKQESERVRQHYENEAHQSQSAADALVSKIIKDFEPLRKYEGLGDGEAEAQRLLADALKEATALRTEAQSLLEKSRTAAAEERSQASLKAREIREQADALLDRATRDAGRIVEEGHKRAEAIAGDAYTALRDKERLEQAAKAIRNVIEGYGDRYIIPTRSLVDDLASDFGHTEAGASLTAAREQTRRMVEEGQAADCEYAETNRRETAIRFVIDAFNGRVDAILTRTKHDNYGTLEQEIRDAFSLVNQNGKAFRDARIVPAYLDARLAELKWAVVVQELRRKEREEQRRIKEQMREEEKARREYERAVREAEEEEVADRKALEKARIEVAHASAEQKAKLEGQIAELNQRLAEAEAKKQRALSMAEQTRRGTVYTISNVGSFGEGVFKIGMTRRLEPEDRIKELSDASVPFEFDVHAMIPNEDAPALENLLQTEFDDLRINKVNFRKEFFRLPLERLRSFLAAKSIEASFTMIAEAREYQETQALGRMTPAEREKYHLRRASGDDAGSE
jgi:hypothetical protein